MLVVCAGCNTNYSLDERTFSGTGMRLNCRECGTETIVALPGTPAKDPRGPFAADASRVQTPAAQAPPPEPPPVAPQRPATHVVAAAATTYPTATTYSTATTYPTATTCPSCGHRFVPGEQAAPPAPPQPAAKTQSRLLLVEDQSYFIQLTRDALGPDFAITAVSDVSAARQALGGNRFDLVILDLSLDENQDGRGLLRSVHERSIPVLIFTACDESEFYGSAWEDLKAAGATDIVLKGVNVGEELKRKVVAIVGKAAAQRA